MTQERFHGTMKHMNRIPAYLWLLNGLVLTPGAIAFAQERALKDILSIFIDLIDVIIPLIMLLALVFFIWGAIQLIYGAGNDASRNAAKQTMVWGTIALFCMVAIWGIVVIIQRSFFG